MPLSKPPELDGIRIYDSIPPPRKRFQKPLFQQPQFSPPKRHTSKFPLLHAVCPPCRLAPTRRKGNQRDPFFFLPPYFLPLPESQGSLMLCSIKVDLTFVIAPLQVMSSPPSVINSSQSLKDLQFLRSSGCREAVWFAFF